MKLRLVILIAGMLMFATTQGFTEEGHDHGTHEEITETEAINVGNKICPISGEEIGSMGEGVQVEHKGKIYNLCCKMCAKDFKKDPEKFIEKINEELEGHDDKEHEEHDENEEKGSHGHDDHHDHDH